MNFTSSAIVPRQNFVAKIVKFLGLDECLSITIKMPYRSELPEEQRQELDEFLAGRRDINITIKPV